MCWKGIFAWMMSAKRLPGKLHAFAPQRHNTENTRNCVNKLGRSSGTQSKVYNIQQMLNHKKAIFKMLKICSVVTLHCLSPSQHTAVLIFSNKSLVTNSSWTGGSRVDLYLQITVCVHSNLLGEAGGTWISNLLISVPYNWNIGRKATSSAHKSYNKGTDP